jgi:hypothetical protein
LTVHAKAIVARAKLSIAVRNPMLGQIKPQISELY